MNEHSQPPRTSVSSNVVDLDAKVVPIFLSLVDVLQKGLTAPEVKGGGEEEAVDALERWQHREELGGWRPSGTGGTERSPMPISAQLHCVTNKGVARVSGGGATCDRARVDTDL